MQKTVTEKIKQKIIRPSRISNKSNGLIKSFAVNTNRGLVKKYNEDRISIILNIKKPLNYQKQMKWPKCFFFGIFDGHGGQECSDFLRDNLHEYIITSTYFPEQPQQAIKVGFDQCEKAFLKQAESSSHVIIAGSCALITLFVNEICYIANVGDCRAVLSSNKGSTITPLSIDHKPKNPMERVRVTDAGGKIYQNKLTPMIRRTDKDSQMQQKIIIGPLRVFPGKLAVSRAFGDIRAKKQKYGGKKGVIIAEPEIKVIKISKEHDFIILASDGIWDKVENKEIIDYTWKYMKSLTGRCDSVHQLCGQTSEEILNLVLRRKSYDNVSVIIIGFQQLSQFFATKLQSINYNRLSYKLKNQKVYKFSKKFLSPQHSMQRNNSTVYNRSSYREKTYSGITESHRQNKIISRKLSHKQINYSHSKIKPISPEQHFNFNKKNQLRPFKVQRKRKFESFQK